MLGLLCALALAIVPVFQSPAPVLYLEPEPELVITGNQTPFYKFQLICQILSDKPYQRFPHNQICNFGIFVFSDHAIIIIKINDSAFAQKLAKDLQWVYDPEDGYVYSEKLDPIRKLRLKKYVQTTNEIEIKGNMDVFLELFDQRNKND